VSIQLHDRYDLEERHNTAPLTRPLPQEATAARPGSEEKILVLQGRASRGELLYHPNDADHESGQGALKLQGLVDPRAERPGEPYPFMRVVPNAHRRRRSRRVRNLFTEELGLDEE
jgi:hypothetical protein